jgi:serine/threonine-protein kinase ULK4
VSKLISLFGNQDLPASKLPLVSYIIKQSKNPEVAENLANTPLLARLLDFVADTTAPQLAALFLALFGVLLGSAPQIGGKFLKPEPLEKFCTSPHPIIARKAVAAVGELATYLARNELEFPRFVSPVILNALRSPDEIIRHVAVQTIGNLLSFPGFASYFDAVQIEAQLTRMDFAAPALLEAFGSCCSSLYAITKASSTEFVVGLAKALINSEGNNAKLLGLILGVRTNTLSVIKEGIVATFKNATGEVKLKTCLALSLTFRDIPQEFVELSTRFFPSLEKIQQESPDVYNALMDWTVDFTDAIVDLVSNGANFELLQIVYQALQIRALAVRIWTPKFEKKIQKIVRNTTFNSVKSEVALQIIQCALCYQICSVQIVADLCRALNSQLGLVRFTVVKLVADISTQRPIPTSVVAFIESNIVTQLLSLLQDEGIIVEQTLRILLSVTSEKPAILGLLVRPNILSLIVANVTDNVSALEVIKAIIQSGTVSADALVNARLVFAILSSMDRKENQPNAMSLLFVTLNLIERQLNEAKSVNAKRAMVKSVNALASMAPRVAGLVLEHPQAGPCLSMLVRIFTPIGAQNEVVIDSSFHPFSISLSQGCRKPEHSATLAQVIRVLQWAAETSAAMRLRIKGSGTLVAALKKASEYGGDELKQAALNCQKALRG